MSDTYDRISRIAQKVATIPATFTSNGPTIHALAYDTFGLMRYGGPPETVFGLPFVVDNRVPNGVVRVVVPDTDPPVVLHEIRIKDLLP